MKPIAQNRRARYDYELLDTIEAGIELRGGEVKSIKAGEVSISEAFVKILGDEAHLVNAYVKPYQNQGHEIDTSRSRKLLLHKQELTKLIGASREASRTVIPTKIYLKRGLVKVEIALAKGKKAHDKRESIKAKDQKREAAQAVRESHR